MVRLIATTALLSLLGIHVAAAQGSCATNAVSKDGKALAGAARTSAIKKCCQAAAVSKDGKALAGAAKDSSVKKCVSESS